MRLTDPVTLAGWTAQSRVVFGPHETNLGRRPRLLGPPCRLLRSAGRAGGAGVIVTETASVHAVDWPYERAPLAADCRAGLAAHRRGLPAAAAHWCWPGSATPGCRAPPRTPRRRCGRRPASPTPSAARRPMEMEQPEIDALVDGFAPRRRASRADAGLDGVEINAGPDALLRQFHSGLTNQRTDAYGRTGCALTRAVLRRGPGRDRPRPGPRPAAVLRRAGPLGRDHPGDRRGAGRRGSPPTSTCSRSCGAGPTRPAPTGPTGTPRRVQPGPGRRDPGVGGRRGAGRAAGQRGGRRRRRRPRSTTGPPTWSR